jgi:hypothetical protein
VLLLDRLWLKHKSLAIEKTLTAPFYFPQAFEVYNLTPNQLKFADFYHERSSKFEWI